MLGLQTEVLWIIAVVFFALVEAFTIGMASIWFAVGALFAFVLALFDVSVILQISAFILVSVVSFLLLRKVALKSVTGSRTQTDIGRIIGKEVIITQTVDNLQNTGKARINDVEWRVQSATGETIDEGKIATVEKIEGVKLIVKG